MRSFMTKLSTVARRAAAPILLVAALAAACGGDGVGPATPVSLAGNYVMTSVEGYGVPHTFTDAAGSQLRIDGGTLVMRDDGSYELQYSGRLNAGDFTLGNDGLYDTSNGLRFFPATGGSYSAQVNGSTITFQRKIAGVAFDLGFTVQ
jgi:hypothetical protein